MFRYVPVSWFCFNIGVHVKVFDCAVPSILGFLCDCGTWVNGSSKYHKVLRKEKRKCFEYVEREK